MRTTKARKKPKAPRDPDYRAAWKACRKPWAMAWGGGEVDLRVELSKLLKSGWSIQALKAYAWGHFHFSPRFDYVTAAPWRYAVHFAHDDLVSGRHGPASATAFLEFFNAHPDGWAHVKCSRT